VPGTDDSEIRLALQVAFVKHGLRYLAAHASEIGEYQAGAVLDALVLYEQARHRLIRPDILQPGTDAKN